jgi:hypothetical protein
MKPARRKTLLVVVSLVLMSWLVSPNTAFAADQTSKQQLQQRRGST